MPSDDKAPVSSMQVVKACEFFAHVDTVVCAHIGRRSGQLLATGSADRVVNIWKIGNNRAELNLRGHSDTVGCVKFTGNEETILSGCRDGSIRIWDLHHNGALKGRIHVQNRAISAIDPHPYGEFFATGTIDGKLEIWNSKQRKKIATYRGNNSAISVLKHSPDGQYIVAGHSSGAVKVWDLTACKLRGELPGNERGRVNAIAFHPQEMTFSIGSDSGLVEVIEIWEQEISTFATSEIRKPIQEMVLNSDGNALLCAGDSFVETFSIDQPRMCLLGQNFDINLSRLVDLCYDQNDSVVLAASVENSAVSIHSISASEDIGFHTNLYKPPVIEPFMYPKGITEKSSPRRSESVLKGIVEGQSANEQSLLTEHAIDDYVAVDNILPLLLADHDSIMLTLNNRLTKLRQLCALWTHGHITETLQKLIEMNDFAVTADFLAATQRTFNNGVLTLQLCPSLLSVIYMLLGSSRSAHIKSALCFLEMLLLCYSEVISSTRKTPMLTACDVAREERLAKCNDCYKILVYEILERIEVISEGDNELHGISEKIINQIRNLG